MSDERDAPGGEGPGGVGPGPDLHRRIDRIVGAVVPLSRVTVLMMVALSVITGVQTHAYKDAPLAVGVYLAVAGYGAWFAAMVLRRRAAPTWAMAADIAVTCAGVVLLPLAASAQYFAVVANSDLEPVMVSAAVAVALVTASARGTAAGCLALATGYVVGQAWLAHTATGAMSVASPVCWMATTAWCCWVFIRRLRGVADAVEAANRQVLAQREQVAAERAEAVLRRRHFREQIRRHRALHDGPLRILTAIAGPGPMGHPDPATRRACAIAVNVLRGTTPDEPEGTLTDLSLALIEAGADSAAAGLRVEYHFAGLPDDLPADAVRALSLAAAEALSNVATHAGVVRARLTALSTGGADRPAVVVSVVDQGKGFDPADTEPGYGIHHSIVGRMRELGGDAVVDSHPGQGTRVDLRWPA